jgi:TDG/mug DNA glycosylase family protein
MSAGPLRVWKPTPEQLTAARNALLPDILGPDLAVLFCGINPSLYSAAVGHNFARPGNRFWPALHAAGFTDRLYSPFEDREMLSLGYGFTNLVARATARADELANEEFVAGAAVLQEKVRRSRPRAVAFLGVGAYRTAFGRPRATLGKQPECLAEAMVWVLPSPSGLNQHYQLADLGRIYGELQIAVIGEKIAVPRRPGGAVFDGKSNGGPERGTCPKRG